MVERDLTPVGGTKAYTLNAVSSTNNWIGGSTDQNGVSKRTMYYGAGGNLVDDIRVGGSTYTYIYNHRKRVIAVQVGGSNVGTYGYDAFGSRVWRTVYSPSVVTTHYVFDTAGHLLAEQNGSTGAVIKEYVWLDDMPLAVIDSSSGTAKTYYIHTGPVNEPLVMTDSTKAQVWNAYMEPFGAATVFGSPSAALDLRLPGQWLEAETGGLNQNWMRDYDPSLGRYVQPDPLGLDAWQNIYAYVDGDPLDWIDPWGLVPGAPYPTPSAAALQALRDINPTSISQHREYAGRICQMWFGLGSCTYTPPIPGSKDHSTPGTCPFGNSNVGMYHTHGGNDPGYDNEHFSPKDKDAADREQVPSYLGTPSGNALQYTPDPFVPRSGNVQQIGKTPQ